MTIIDEKQAEIDDLRERANYYQAERDVLLDIARKASALMRADPMRRGKEIIELDDALMAYAVQHDEFTY